MDYKSKIKACRQHVESLLADKGHAGLQETSYPSRSLRFLQALDEPGPSKPELDQAKIKLSIIIAGAGIGGLAAAIALRRRGHSVIVFEKAPELGEVGAGIQVPPNSSRLLLKWGLGPYLQGKANEPEAIRMRRWQNGELLSQTKLHPESRILYGAPYYVVHRADLQLSMYALALALGAEIILNSPIKTFYETTASVELFGGEIHSADLVVAADGIKSEARRVVLGGVDEPPVFNGFAAYRAIVDTKLMEKDPEISWLLETPGQNLWVGDQRHVMSYTIAGGKSFNMVLSHPEASDPSTWNQNIVLENMKQHFEGWDPSLVKVIRLIRTTLKWPLLTGRPLPNWLSPSGALLIIGDAAHAMLPYMSEGAATAVEDGAALAEILSLVTCRSQLHSALKVFEQERILRTGQMQEASLVNGKLWHFADGPEQQARDAAMRLELEEHSVGESPNQWSDPVTAAWVYGYDAEVTIRRIWMEGNGETKL